MASFAALIYLVASVLFILALRGLSHPETAQRGLQYGKTGMALAIVTTILLPQVSAWLVILLGIAVGGSVGTYTAYKIAMTALPQLMAAFHSLVGLAAVFYVGAQAKIQGPGWEKPNQKNLKLVAPAAPAAAADSHAAPAAAAHH